MRNNCWSVYWCSPRAVTNTRSCCIPICHGKRALLTALSDKHYVRSKFGQRWRWHADADRSFAIAIIHNISSSGMPTISNDFQSCLTITINLADNPDRRQNHQRIKWCHFQDDNERNWREVRWLEMRENDECNQQNINYKGNISTIQLDWFYIYNVGGSVVDNTLYYKSRDRDRSPIPQSFGWDSKLRFSHYNYDLFVGGMLHLSSLTCSLVMNVTLSLVSDH